MRTLPALFNKPTGIMKKHIQICFVADDIKEFFRAITSFDDHTQLQTDIHSIYKCCILCMQDWCLAKPDSHYY